MSDEADSPKDALTRRAFLRGGFLPKDGCANNAPGRTPGKYTAIVAHDGEDIEAERRRAREVLGKIREPDVEPFDFLTLLAGLDTETLVPIVEQDENEEGRLVASIQPYACLAHLGTFCSVCRERCPEVGAIELVQDRPRINPGLCTGCGLCEEICPAPGGAIVISRM
ncbi:MAG: 4Fe-4S binding protein [Bradymonadaceae bacterium]